FTGPRAGVGVLERVLDAEREFARRVRGPRPHHLAVHFHRLGQLGGAHFEHELGADLQVALAVDGHAALGNRARVVAEQGARRRIADREPNGKARMLATLHAFFNRILPSWSRPCWGSRLGGIGSGGSVGGAAWAPGS